MSDIKGKALSFGGINTRDLAPQVENLTLKGGDGKIDATFSAVAEAYASLVKYYVVTANTHMPQSPSDGVSVMVMPGTGTLSCVLSGLENGVVHHVRVFIRCTYGWQTSPVAYGVCTPMAGIALGDAPLGTLVNLPRTDNANAFKLISVNHYEVNASYPQNACILIHNISEQKSSGYFATSSKLDISSWVTYLNGTWLSGFEDGIQSKLIEVGASNTGKAFLPSYAEVGGESAGNFAYFVDDASRISANSIGWQTRTLYTYKDSDGHTYYACYGVTETGVIQGQGSPVLSGMVLWQIRPCVCLSSDLLLNPNPNADGSYDLLPV